MFIHELHVPLFDDENDRRTVYIQLAPDLSLQHKRLWHWANIVLPLDQIDQNTLTEQHRAEGWNAGYLYWCLIQEAEFCATLCAASHLNDLLPLANLPIETLNRIRDDFGRLDLILFSQEITEEMEASKSLTFPDYRECIVGAEAAFIGLGMLMQSKQQPPFLPNGRPGFVYLLKSVTGHWKIGRTVSPKDRLKTFGIQLPFEVEFEHLIPTNNMAEAESRLHIRFEARHVNGEWFALTDEDVAYIKSIERM